MGFVDMLDDSLYVQAMLRIKTKDRGEIIGTPYRVDEFESDSDRLGYCLFVGGHEIDTIFLDEIVSIQIIQETPDFQNAM